jgi:hypothetical protein
MQVAHHRHVAAGIIGVPGAVDLGDGDGSVADDSSAIGWSRQCWRHARGRRGRHRGATGWFDRSTERDFDRRPVTGLGAATHGEQVAAGRQRLERHGGHEPVVENQVQIEGYEIEGDQRRLPEVLAVDGQGVGGRVGCHVPHDQRRQRRLRASRVPADQPGQRRRDDRQMAARRRRTLTLHGHSCSVHGTRHGWRRW